MPDNVKINAGFKNASIHKEIKTPGSRSEAVFRREERYAAHNYAPIPVALTRGKGEIYSYFFCCVTLVFLY